MSVSFASKVELQNASFWNKVQLFGFTLEVTARCNNNCRHCYINLPADDGEARIKELSLEEIEEIADEAISLGAVRCLITGGEPLLRRDFWDIYMALIRKGLLVGLFTNATLIREEDVRLLKQYPPAEIEVTVYGITEATYEAVTRVKGSFKRFMRGLNLLLDNGVKVTLKAMALRSNVHELLKIRRFCLERTTGIYRFDPFLTLRLDGYANRNAEIKSERLSPKEIVAIEERDPERYNEMIAHCDSLIFSRSEAEGRSGSSQSECGNQARSTVLFGCGIGKGKINVGYDGTLRLCHSLSHPNFTCNVRHGGLVRSYPSIVSKVRGMRSDRRVFIERCGTCPIFNLCFWCPANCYLETGELDMPVDYFCEIAHARARMLEKACREKRG